MKFSEYKQNIEKMINEDYKSFIMAFTSIELGINNRRVLEDIYDEHMESVNSSILFENIDEIIENIKLNNLTIREEVKTIAK